MSELILHQGTWVAVCDGSKALFLENTGGRVYPKLETRAVMNHESPPTHEQGTDAPGRAFSTADGRRGAVEETDFHLQAEEQFLRNVAEKLDHQVRENKIRDLFLIAPARALGILRKLVGPATQKAITGELDRDYVKLPVYEIERYLTAP